LLNETGKRTAGAREVIVIDPIGTPAARKTRVAAYARVSSGSDEQKRSFAAQLRHYTDKIAKNPDWEFVDIYADPEVTGTRTDKRDEFNRMLNDCRKGKVDIILTKTISRFARNTADCLQYVRELRSLGISIRFEEQNLNTAELKDELALTFLGSAAQEESLSISANMRWSYKHRMKSGKFITCSRPYGYRLDNGGLSVDINEAETIRHIYQSYLAGNGVMKIAAELTKMNVPKKHGGTEWRWCTIDGILKNEKYVGDSLLQKQYMTDIFPYVKVRNKGEKDQYYIKNSHEPIISRTEFKQVQALACRKTRQTRAKTAIYRISAD
jgi:DNA invertase Pin-like site-specific DNA recombinase